MGKNLNSLSFKAGKLTRKYWYVPVIIVSILFLIQQNVDFKIRTNDSSSFYNCVLTGLIKSKYTDKAGVEATIYICRRAEELRTDKWITQRGRIWE
jgi:hypothetical protein